MLIRALVLVGVLATAGCGSPLTGGPAAVAVRTSAPAAPRQFTLLGAGDILLHDRLWATARKDAGAEGYDFRPMLAALGPAVSGADLAICHLETPLGEPAGPFSGYPSFNVPPQVATGLKQLGYDSCSTASNHTLDAGERGVYRTLDTLDVAGLQHTGSYRSRAAHDTPTILDVRGVKVAQVSYTFSFNGQHRPAGKEWITNLLDAKAVLDEARRARAAGAEIVVASIHWGTEYQHEPDAEQRRVARELLADPAVDLILGAHAHVVQPFEQVNGKWVAYGMGNQVSHQDFSDDVRDGVMPRFTFTETAPHQWQVTKAEAVPTWMELKPGAARVRVCGGGQCAASAARTLKTVRSLGAPVS